MTDVRILRADDPEAAELQRAGWRVAHRSWGARLAGPLDPDHLERLIATVVAEGYEVGELGPDEDTDVLALEAATRRDYPGGPATAPPLVSAASIADDRAGGTRWFGARRDGAVVALTAIRPGPDRAETDHTAVAAGHRRRGLAAAVKAASVRALAAEGATTFGTGGAAENAASLAMNARLGYVVTERWLTLVPPPGRGGCAAG